MSVVFLILYLIWEMCTKYDNSAEKRQAFLKSVYMYSAHGCMQRRTIDCGTPMYIHIYTISSPRTTNVGSDATPDI